MNWSETGPAWVELLARCGFPEVLQMAGRIEGTGREPPFHSQVGVDYWIGSKPELVVTRVELTSQLHAVDHFFLRVSPAGVLEKVGTRLKFLDDTEIGDVSFDRD